MKKYYIILAAAMACLATACSDNILPVIDPEQPDSPKVTYIKANANEDATKASIDGASGAFTWNTGDQIAVCVSNDSPNPYHVSDGLESNYDGANNVYFKFSGNNVVDQTKRVYYAIYPASIVDNGSSKARHGVNGLAVCLPASYEFEQVAGAKSPTPMVATNEPNGALQFKQLCAMLRVTVKDIPTMTDHLEFAFPDGLKVAGLFIMNPTATDDITLFIYNLNTGEGISATNKITVTMPANHGYIDEVDINLPVPVIPSTESIGYDKLTVTAYDSDNEAILKITNNIKSDGSKWKPARKAARKMTAPLPVFTISNESNGSEKVVFAPGNLQWYYRKGSINGPIFTHLVNEETSNVSQGIYDQKSYNAGMFFFAPAQYSTLGTGNVPDKRSDKTYSGGSATGESDLSELYLADDNVLRGIDLFMFATSGYRGSAQHGSNNSNYYHYKPFAVCKGTYWSENYDYTYGFNNSNEIKGTNYDWGYYNDISKNREGTEVYNHGFWGLMTIDEWTYLLNSRSDATQKRGFAVVMNQRGLILLPDNWVGSPTHPFVPFTGKISTTDSNPTITWTRYDESDWAAMEAAGAVFLPAAGSINQDTNTIDNWGINTDTNAEGYYWTASQSTEHSISDHYTKAWCFNFGTSGTGNNDRHWRMDNSLRSWGRSVRLVRRLN